MACLSLVRLQHTPGSTHRFTSGVFGSEQKGISDASRFMGAIWHYFYGVLFLKHTTFFDELLRLLETDTDWTVSIMDMNIKQNFTETCLDHT